MKYAFTHCNLLDGTQSMDVQKDMTLVVEEDTIISIIQSGSIPKGATEINIDGKYLLPGMINLHAHLPGNGKPKKAKGVSRISELAEKYQFLRRGIEDTVKTSILTQLYSGVTTIRSLGEICHSDLRNRDRINNKEYIGPTLLVAGYGVTGVGGHMAGSMAVECRSPEESRSLVQKEIQSHVDWIKIFVTGGILDAISAEEPTVLKMPLEIAQAACDEAHKSGYKVAAHAQSEEGVRISLKAGVDTIEHGAKMDEEIIELYKRNKASMIATFSPAIASAKLSTKATRMTEMQRAASLYLLDNMIAGSKQALANDIPLGLGTDCSCPYVTQYDMWREVYYFWKYCKVSRAFALHTATLKNAQILGIDKKTGSLEVGKRADLIVVKENPLEALESLRYVEMVMTKGQLITSLKIKHLGHVDKQLEELR